MASPQKQQSTSADGYPQRWSALAVLLLAGFMNLVDVSIVNVALPRLQHDLGATSSQIEWVVAAYVLAFALALLPFGRLGDVIGRKNMFLTGVACFTLFSILCGVAPSMRLLIIARVFQGLSGAMMMPQVLAITQVIFPPRERGLAFSMFGFTAGLASVAGPLIGGLLINADLFGLDWRPIFLVNIPVGILAIIVGRALIPAVPAHPDLTHDLGGIVLAVVAVFLLVFPLIEGHTVGWPAWTFVMIAASLLCSIVFYFHERRREARNETQLLPVSLMTSGNFMLGASIAMAVFSGVAGFFLVLAVFLQTGFGLTPLQSGLTTLPFSLGVLMASLVAGRLGSRWPRERVAFGAATLCAGMLLLRYFVGGIGDEFNHWTFLPPLLVAGIGLGSTVSSLFQTVLSTVPPRDTGSASGAMQSFQQMGNTLGIAIVGQIFFTALQGGLAAGVANHPAFVDSMRDALVYEALVFGVAAVMVTFLKRPPAIAGHGAPAAPADA
jgi:EmrB/QacA subfamily drug resistance transporter